MPDSVGRVGRRLTMEVVKVVQGLFAKIINPKSQKSNIRWQVTHLVLILQLDLSRHI